MDRSTQLTAQEEDPTPAKEDPAPAKLGKRFPSCTICNHPARREMYEAFVGWHAITEICKRFEVTDQKFAVHIEHAPKWRDARQKNRREMLVKMIAYGAENLDTLGLKGRDIINAIQWLDKLDGLVIDRKEINGPPTVNIIGIPRPGGVLNKASAMQEELVYGGPKVGVYPRLKASEPEEVVVQGSLKKEGTTDG